MQRERVGWIVVFLRRFSMKKAFASLTGILLAAALIGCASTAPAAGSAPAASAGDSGLPTYEVLIGTHLPKESIVVQGFIRMADAMNEKTGGRFTYTLSDAGQLGSQRDILEACNLGSVQFCVGEADLLNSYAPVYGAFALPFMFDSAEHYKACADGAVGQKLISALEAATDLTVVGNMSNGFRSVYLQKPVNSIADLKGVKIRTPESSVYVDTFSALGANPTAVPASEMYSAIQTGVVDGMENVNETIVQYKIYEVVSNCSLTKHIHNDQLIVANKSFVNSMTEEDRALLLECGKEAADWVTEQASSKDAEYRTELEAAGIVYNELDLAEFREAVKAVYDSLSTSVPEVQEIIDGVNALR